MVRKLLFICHDYYPEVTPTTVRIVKILEQLKKDWQIHVLTSFKSEHLGEEIAIHSVKAWYPKQFIAGMRKVKLEKLLEWLIWPDDTIFWVLPALLRGKKLVKEHSIDIAIVFMPYATGFVGILLKWWTKVPLVINFDDSLTCSDMHSFFPSRMHYYMTRWLEDWFIRQSNAVVYVSQRNLERVRERLPVEQRSKFHLVRYAADPTEYSTFPVRRDNSFRITYIGGMSGWYSFFHRPQDQTFLRKIYRAWMKWGRHEVVNLDLRGSSPVFIGQAAQQVMAGCPEWEGRLHIEIYGNRYPVPDVQRVLRNQGLQEIVAVYGPVAHQKAIDVACQADLLFLALPARPDGSAGGRISAKTFEYLMTDRPILAAVPRGENWDYLLGKPGIWLVEPTDVSAMARVVKELAAATFSGKPLRFDRSGLREGLSYQYWAKEFARVLESVYPKRRETRLLQTFTCCSAYGQGGLGLHLAQLVEQARLADQLSGYYTLTTKPGDDAGHTIELRTFSWLQRYSPLRFSPGWLNYWTVDMFDRAVAGRLQPGQVLMAFNGQALHTFRQARRLGYDLLVLVSATAHVTSVLGQYRKAQRSYGIELPWLNTAQARKTIQEYDAADVIQVTSQYMYQTFVQAGVPAARLRRHVLRVSSRFQPARPRSDDGIFRIIYVGSLTVTKGIPVLLEAFHRLPTQSAELILVGGWWSRGMRRYLEAWLRRDLRIHIVPGDPLPHLQQADVYVHPSFSDGFGMAPMEALACGVPVIVTEDTGMKEYVQEGINGFVVPTGDWQAILERLEHLQQHPLVQTL